MTVSKLVYKVIKRKSGQLIENCRVRYLDLACLVDENDRWPDWPTHNQAKSSKIIFGNFQPIWVFTFFTGVLIAALVSAGGNQVGWKGLSSSLSI